MATVLHIGPDAADHVGRLREVVGKDGALDTYSDGRLIARLVAADAYALRRRLVPLLAHLNDVAMGLGCGANGHGTALPAVWSL